MVCKLILLIGTLGVLFSMSPTFVSASGSNFLSNGDLELVLTNGPIESENRTFSESVKESLELYRTALVSFLSNLEQCERSLAIDSSPTLLVDRWTKVINNYKVLPVKLGPKVIMSFHEMESKRRRLVTKVGLRAVMLLERSWQVSWDRESLPEIPPPSRRVLDDFLSSLRVKSPVNTLRMVLANAKYSRNDDLEIMILQTDECLAGYIKSLEFLVNVLQRDSKRLEVAPVKGDSLNYVKLRYYQVIAALRTEGGAYHLGPFEVQELYEETEALRSKLVDLVGERAVALVDDERMTSWEEEKHRMSRITGRHI